MAREKHREAHKKIFTEYYRYVQTIVYNRLRSCGTAEDVEDCVSDVFAAVFIYCDNNVKYGGELKGIICGIARNKAADAFNRLSGNRTVPINETNANCFPSDDNTEKDYEKNEVQKIILRLVKSLGEPDSSIIMQKYYYNRKSDEIGKNLGMKADAVRKRCSRAIDRLRDMLVSEGITF